MWIFSSSVFTLSELLIYTEQEVLAITQKHPILPANNQGLFRCPSPPWLVNSASFVGLGRLGEGSSHCALPRPLQWECGVKRISLWGGKSCILWACHFSPQLCWFSSVLSCQAKQEWEQERLIFPTHPLCINLNRHESPHPALSIPHFNNKSYIILWVSPVLSIFSLCHPLVSSFGPLDIASYCWELHSAQVVGDHWNHFVFIPKLDTQWSFSIASPWSFQETTVGIMGSSGLGRHLSHEGFHCIIHILGAGSHGQVWLFSQEWFRLYGQFSSRFYEVPHSWEDHYQALFNLDQEQLGLISIPVLLVVVFNVSKIMLQQGVSG